LERGLPPPLEVTSVVRVAVHRRRRGVWRGRRGCASGTHCTTCRSRSVNRSVATLKGAGPLPPPPPSGVKGGAASRAMARSSTSATCISWGFRVVRV
jgi:hypothetical protein